jgi:hypothetical protein
MDDPKTLEEAVFQSIGEASVCWEDVPTGVFDSTRAKRVGDELMAFIKKQRTPVHEWPYNDEHVWTDWRTATGLPKATQYRSCIFDGCPEVEYRDAPNG